MHVYHFYFPNFLSCLFNLFNVIVSHMRLPDGYNKAITYLLTYLDCSVHNCNFGHW